MNTLPPADRFSDNITDDPFWNESVWFSFAKPDEKINGDIHYYFRPNMGMQNGGPIIWDSEHNYFWNCLYHNWSHLQAIAPGSEKFNMTANNSLSVKVLEPLTRYSIAYDNDGCQFEFLWDAIGPMHELTSGNELQKNTGMFHIEQPGRMKGTLRLGERVIPIDCFSMRDASSGPRQYGRVIASGSYFWGIAADSCFHAIALGEGDVQNIFGGFIWKDGVMSSIASGTRTALEYGRFSASKVRLDIVDKLGREVTITGNVEPGLIHTGYTTHTVVWSQTEWDWNDVTHYGEHQMFRGAEKFRKIARGELPVADKA